MTLREWLFTQRISITFLAALLKIDRSYIYRWMNGTKIPSEKLMEKIREISLDQVYEKEDLLDVKPIRSKKETQKRFSELHPDAPSTSENV